ncbi:SMOX [Lepeophtheirus salmonis]|uniref:SMOX n=1 Tax=Lepeophtheirus salmonis TaxID=72036 RepID=A0A7R8CP52_LEPSM|nr:SMOX [Lepeophtheirus salmonis]CAF2836757.1 SMOX [Lepeophtheirus salmonis]
MRVNKAKVVIIGAGAAGLFAAKKLIDSGQYGPKDIIILEAQDYVGGRIKPFLLMMVLWKTGAQWIHGRGDNPVWKFVLENNISVAEIANRDGKGNFMSQSGDIPPKEILHSTLNFLQEVHESVLMMFWMMKDSSKMGFLHQLENTLSSGLKSAMGLFYECNTSIVTVSLGVLKASLNMFDYETIKWPSKNLRNNFGIRKNPGVMILRDSDTFKTFDYKDDDPWYNYVYGFDSVLHQPNILMGWMSGEESRAMEMLSDKDIGENCIDLLKRVMSKSNIQAPIRMKNIYVSRWYQNRFCRGTYSYATTACVEKGIHHADLLEPVRYSSGRIALMLAGEATSDNCTGTVHGALMSGELQASKILELNRDSELKK